MAGSLNKVQLIGNVGKDPEIRTSQAGDRIANFSLATSESWTDKRSGEKQERTEWHRVVVFNDGLSGVIEKYVSKGTKLFVEGQLQTRKWTDQSGVERYSTEIVLQKFGGTILLLGGSAEREDGAGRNRDGSGYTGSGSRHSRGGGGEARGFDETRPREDFSADLDDEIPFASGWALR